MKKLTFEPIGEAQAVRTGMLLIEALELKKLNVLRSCGGHGLCATCHVHVRQGTDSLSPMTDREKRTLSFVSGIDATSRLACQARVFGNTAVVELPRGMYIEKAEDLLDLLGSRATENILHPIKGSVLIAKGKIITRTQIEELKHLQAEVSRARMAAGKSGFFPAPPPQEPPPLVRLPTVPAAPPPTVQRGGVGARLPAVPPDQSTGLIRAGGQTQPAGPAPLGLPTAGPEGAARPPGPGDVLGKCVLQSKLGVGSTGTVYRAQHRTLGIAVAVKVLKLPAVASDDGANLAIRQRLRAEAQLLAQINHPNILRLWDFDDEHRFPYLVLELIDGLSMADLIEQSGRLAPERAVALTLQVAEALRAAAEVGVVHRDVKPANILVTREGRAKLADLGLARSLHDGTTSTAGTIAYMPPEQAVGGEVDIRSDIYALGATLFHAVTGRLPFPGKTLQETLFKHANERLDPPGSLAPGIPATLSALIEEMMAKSPEDRPQDYAELIADLCAAVPAAEWLAAQPLTSRKVSSLGRQG
jgi:ferredoxin